MFELVELARLEHPQYWAPVVAAIATVLWLLRFPPRWLPGHSPGRGDARADRFAPSLAPPAQSRPASAPEPPPLPPIELRPVPVKPPPIPLDVYKPSPARARAHTEPHFRLPASVRPDATPVELRGPDVACTEVTSMMSREQLEREAERCRNEFVDPPTIPSVEPERIASSLR